MTHPCVYTPVHIYNKPKQVSDEGHRASSDATSAKSMFWNNSAQGARHRVASVHVSQIWGSGFRVDHGKFSHKRMRKLSGPGTVCSCRYMYQQT